MMYSGYAVHSVDWWSWHREIERDYATLCSAIMVELWNTMRDRGWRWQQYGGYKPRWEIGRTTCLIGFGRPCISVITRCIRSYTCRIGHYKLTCTRNSLSPSFSWWFPSSPPISLFFILNSTSTEEHNVQSMLSISPWHDHELTPSSAYTEYCIIRRWSVSHSQPVSSHILVDLLLVNSIHSDNHELTNE